MLDPSYGRLWAAAALIRLTIRAGRALGRALHQAGLAEPLAWPNGRVCDAPCEFDTMAPRAPHTRVRRRPLHLTNATQDRAICQDLGADDKWSRLSHLGSSYSVGNERAAAVQ